MIHLCIGLEAHAVMLRVATFSQTDVYKFCLCTRKSTLTRKGLFSVFEAKNLLKKTHVPEVQEVLTSDTSLLKTTKPENVFLRRHWSILYGLGCC